MLDMILVLNFVHGMECECALREHVYDSGFSTSLCQVFSACLYSAIEATNSYNNIAQCTEWAAKKANTAYRLLEDQRQQIAATKYLT